MKKVTCIVAAGAVGLLLGLFSPPVRQASARTLPTVKVDTACVDSRYPCDYGTGSLGGSDGSPSCGPNRNLAPACVTCTKTFGGFCQQACSGGQVCKGGATQTEKGTCVALFACDTVP